MAHPLEMLDKAQQNLIRSRVWEFKGGIPYRTETMRLSRHLHHDRESWRIKTADLPYGFENSSTSLNFSNGPLTDAEFGRLEKPDATYLANPQQDDSDYDQTQGCFYPGTMLSADSGNQISAGVLVEKNGEIRLTVAFHCWTRTGTGYPTVRPTNSQSVAIYR
jgi:hypothetical protein